MTLKQKEYVTYHTHSLFAINLALLCIHDMKIIADTDAVCHNVVVAREFGVGIQTDQFHRMIQ